MLKRRQVLFENLDINNIIRLLGKQLNRLSNKYHGNWIFSGC